MRVHQDFLALSLLLWPSFLYFTVRTANSRAAESGPARMRVGDKVGGGVWFHEVGTAPEHGYLMLKVEVRTSLNLRG